MPNEAKPTPGPYSINSRYVLEADLPGGTEVIAHFYNGDEGPPTGSAAANTQLAFDAFNVYHETGLTPRQLAEQRAELLEMLKCILRDWEGSGWGYKPATLGKLRAAISKVEGQK